MVFFYSTLLWLSMDFICGKWMPGLGFSPNFDQFQIYRSRLLENVVYSAIGGSMPIDFQWQTVASVSVPSNKTSYIIYGGSLRSTTQSKTAFSKQFSCVLICELNFSNGGFNLNHVTCKNTNPDNNNIFLGATIKAIQLSDKYAVIAYCDPLWHLANTSEPKPSGKCYFSFINNGEKTRNTSIEFCRLSSTSFLSCLGGFSLDLLSTNQQLSGLQIIVGMPYLPPFGRVKIINDPFGSKSTLDPRNGGGDYFNFGYAVSMTTSSVAYASSSLSVVNLRQNIKFISPDNVPFSSFGMTLTTLKIDEGRGHAIVIGAPFYSVKTMINVGKIYVFCVSNDNSNNNSARLSAQIQGQQSDQFYGYVITNIGDINGDGSEDMAISSPFLRNDDARGFVSIYTVSGTCIVNARPHQILRSARFPKRGIFGLSVTGGSDLDFNGWPDIVILNSLSNSIELYASRTILKAKCKYSLDNNYELEQLRNDEKIQIKVHVSLIDVVKISPVNLNFLKQRSLISQIDPNFNTTEHRFDLDIVKTTFSLSVNSVSVQFVLKSLMHVEDMNLSMPVIIAFRLVEDCSMTVCDYLQFPVIDWEDCKIHVPIRKFICSIDPICNADLSAVLIDLQGTKVIYGYGKRFSRSLELKIFNSGPTEGKSIHFKVLTNQNLRIHKIVAKSDVVLKEVMSENQTEAIYGLDKEELDVDSLPIIISIDLYFVDFQTVGKMIYSNNFLTVDVFSDIKDSNISNNRAKVLYEFIYEPNITYSGSPLKETIIDSRNRTQLVRYGKRLPLDSLGPMLSQQYIVENVGHATVSNMIVFVNIPLETHDGYRILYFLDKIRGVNRPVPYWMSIAPQIYVGKNHYPCVMPKKYVNPLNIIGFGTNEFHLKTIDIRQMNDRKHKVYRRSVNSTVTKEPYNEDDIAKGKMNRIPVEIIQCNRPGVNIKSPVCAEMICTVPVLLPNNQARLQINSWIWAHTFYKKQIADFLVFTTLRTDFQRIPDGVQLKWDKTKSYSQAQHFIFPNFKSKIRHFKPCWPITVGIVIGILILSILIVAMYRCGFFHRNRLKEHFKIKNAKNSIHHPVIVHNSGLQTASTGSSETPLTQHSAFIS